MKTLGRFAFRKKYYVIGFWLIALFGITAIAQSVGSNFSDSFSLPGTDSMKALSLLGKAFPGKAGDTETIVFHVKTGTVNDPSVKNAMQGVFAKVSGISSVGAVNSPYEPINARQISQDQTTAYAPVNFSVNARLLKSKDVQALVDAGKAASTSNLEI